MSVLLQVDFPYPGPWGAQPDAQSGAIGTLCLCGWPVVAAKINPFTGE